MDAHTASQVPDSSATAATTPPRGRVLLADDETDLLKAYKRGLRSQGFEVETVADGQAAEDAFRNGDFDVVVSDIAMPGLDGVELLRAIRQHDLDVPVILVTGEPSVETAIQALDYGALRYLVKPIEADELAQVVQRASSLYRMAKMKREALEMLGQDDMQLGDRAGLEVKFESALEKLYMVYQPIVRWSRKEVAGYESLVRTAEPTIPHPGALFDAAERLDRVTELSRRIREAAPGPLQSADRGLLFFNLHVRDLNDPTLFDPNAPIAQMADRVVLEVTERASLSEVTEIRNRVMQLREMGFRIAVDDLGAGYAGLNSFAMLEPDVVKLDMAMVRNIHESATKQKLARSMISVSEEMGMEVVAEGIEYAQELEVLANLGCDLFQGFFFAKPARPFAEVNWGWGISGAHGGDVTS